MKIKVNFRLHMINQRAADKPTKKRISGKKKTKQLYGWVQQAEVENTYPLARKIHYWSSPKQRAQRPMMTKHLLFWN